METGRLSTDEIPQWPDDEPVSVILVTYIFPEQGEIKIREFRFLPRLRYNFAFVILFSQV